MQDTELAYLSAHEALAAFRKRSLSPVDVLDALIARHAAVGGIVNAFTDLYFDEAREKARQAEARFASGTARPLEGIALAVKDAQRVAGRRTSYGSLALMDNVDDHSDPMIERLEAAGAIIHARSTTPEFCLSGMCWSRAWGITRNPFNPDYTPGGSSGGSSAALAAGLTTIATGTDIGGSIRIPAGTCAIVGFKPPHGRNPDGPPSNFDLYNHCGPMTRSVADAALIQNIVSGVHPRDHWSLRDKVTIPDVHAPVKAMRIAWSMDLGFMEIDPEVAANTRAALAILKDMGCIVEEVAVPWTRAVEQAAVHWYNSMHYGRQTIWHAARHPELLTPYALNFARLAEQTTQLDDMAHSWETVQQMYEFFGPLMENYDCFICPTNSVPAVKADHDPCNPDFFINGVRVDPENGWVLTYPFNMLHACPVMSVPSGRSPTTGVPTGIQIVGRSYDDLPVFRLASAYEQAARHLFVTADNHPL